MAAFSSSLPFASASHLVMRSLVLCRTAASEVDVSTAETPVDVSTSTLPLPLPPPPTQPARDPAGPHGWCHEQMALDGPHLHSHVRHVLRRVIQDLDVRWPDEPMAFVEARADSNADGVWSDLELLHAMRIVAAPALDAGVIDDAALLWHVRTCVRL